MAVTLDQASAILNQSLVDLGFEATIPLASAGATDTEITNAYKAIGAYNESAKNSLLKQVNTILVFRNYYTMFDASKNPTRKFWREDTKFGGGIEDIYHDLITPLETAQNGDYWAEDFAGLSAQDENTLASNIARDLVKYYGDNIKKKFHTKHGRFTIPLSITDLEVEKAFTPDGFTNYINVKMANLQASAEVAMQNVVIDIVKDMITKEDIVFDTDHDLSTQTGISNYVERLQTVTDAMTNISNAFNKDGHITISDSEDLYYVTTPEVINRIRVQGYANAYNLKEFAIRNKIILLPYGTDLGTYGGKKVNGVLLDKRSIVMSLRYWKVKPFIVSNTDYENYFLKVQYLKGYNEFFNAVAFVGEVEE